MIDILPVNNKYFLNSLEYMHLHCKDTYGGVVVVVVVVVWEFSDSNTTPGKTTLLYSALDCGNTVMNSSIL